MRAKILSAGSIGFSSDSSIRSMLTEDEKALYFVTARDAYSARGAVIEIGPWLGGGTIQIVRGLEATRHKWHLTVYDRFTWSTDAQRKYPEGGLTVGDSFLPRFKEGLGSFQDRITPIEAELTDITSKLPLTQNIELLFIDAPKSWSLLRKVLIHVGPKLLPGASLVFQDFLHIASRQIVWLVMSLPQFTITTTVEKGTAILCTVTEPLTDVEKTVPPTMAGLTERDLLALWERGTNMLPEEKGGELAAGMALDLYARNARKSAARILDIGVVGKPWHDHIIHRVQKLIKFGNPKNRPPLVQVNRYLVKRKRAISPPEAGGLNALEDQAGTPI